MELKSISIDKLITKFRPIYHKSKIIEELRADNYTQFEDNFWDTVKYEILEGNKIRVWSTWTELFTGEVLITTANIFPISILENE